MAKVSVAIRAYNTIEMEIPDELLKMGKINGHYFKCPIDMIARYKIFELAQNKLIEEGEEIISIIDEQTDSILYEM